MKTSKSNTQTTADFIANAKSEIAKIKAQIASEKQAMREKLNAEKAVIREQQKIANAQQREQAKLEREREKLAKAKAKAKVKLANFKKACSIRIELGTKVSFTAYRADSNTKYFGTVVNYTQFRNGHVAYIVKTTNGLVTKSFNSLTVVK